MPTQQAFMVQVDAVRDWFPSAGSVMSNLALSALLGVALLIAYRIARRSLVARRWVTPDVRKRWIVMARNAGILILLLGLVIVWAEELQTLALSLVAISLALVVAVKELLLCVGGEILRSSTRLFTVGSRIEVQGVRGDVIDLNLLTTAVMEVGPGRATHKYTGRVVLFPNSLFLAHPVYNESFTEPYLLHTFSVAVRPEAWSEADRAMRRAAKKVCAEYLDGARRHIEALGEREGLDTPSADPDISLGMPEPDRVELVVRIPVPTRRKQEVQQRILRRFFELFQDSGMLRGSLPPSGAG